MKREIGYSILMLLLSLMILLFYPFDGSFSLKNFLILIPLFSLQASFLSIYSLTQFPVYLLLSVFLLFPINKHAIALGVWALYGTLRVREFHSNLIKPDLKAASNILFSTPFTLLALISALLLYPSLTFTVPERVLDLAVDTSLKMYGNSLPCDVDQTLSQCVEELFEKKIEECKGEAGCIALLKSQENVVKENLRKGLLQQFPSFTETTTLREAFKKSIREPLEALLLEYQSFVKILAALVLVFTFQIVGKISQPISYLFSIIVLKVMKGSGVIREKKIKVDKIIYEV